MAARRGCLPLVAVLLALLCRAEAAVRELKVGYYAETCPEAEGIVREVMARARAREARSVASVMRLQFHDCFVNVSDPSIHRSTGARLTSLRLHDVVFSGADLMMMAGRGCRGATGRC